MGRALCRLITAVGWIFYGLFRAVKWLFVWE